MQVSLTATGGLERRLEVAVPADASRQRGRAAAEAALPHRAPEGLPSRQGAATRWCAKQFGDQVHAEVVSDLMRSTFAEAVSQEKLPPAGGPAHRADRDGARHGSEVRGASSR